MPSGDKKCKVPNEAKRKDLAVLPKTLRQIRLFSSKTFSSSGVNQST